MNERTSVPSAGRRFRRTFVAALAACIGVLVIAPGGAFAENTVVSSNPADGTSVATSPASIEIVFGEELGEQNTIALSCNTDLYTLGRPSVGDDKVTLSADVIDPLPKGTCVARWAVSDADGKPNGDGTITFNVDNAAPTTQPTTTVDGTDTTETTGDPNASAATTGGTSAPSNDQVTELADVDTGKGPLWLGRLLSVFGIAVLFGSLVVIAAAWPEGVEYLLAVRFLRTAWIVALIGTFLYVAAAAAAVSGDSLGAGFSPASWGDLLDAGVPGIAVLARLVLVVASAWVAFRPDRVIDPAMQMAALGIPAFAVITIGFDRTNGDLAVLGVTMGIVHALAMAIWVGGVVLLARVVLAGPGEEDLVHAVRGFGRLSNLAIIVTIVTGVVQMVLLDGGDLFGSSHGQVVIVKTIVVAVMVFVAMSARQFVNQRLGRAHEMSVPMADRLRRAFGIEAASGFLVLAMSAWLIALTPPNVSTGPAIDYAITQRVQVEQADLDVTVSLTRDTVGTSGLAVEVDAPDAGLSGLEVVLTAPPNDTIGTITQPVPLTGPGLAVLPAAKGVPLSVPGIWTITVNAVVDSAVVNSEPVGVVILNADGTPATTVLTIPPVITVTIPPTTADTGG